MRNSYCQSDFYPVNPLNPAVLSIPSSMPQCYRFFIGTNWRSAGPV
jgi:hypothetical protein